MFHNTLYVMRPQEAGSAQYLEVPPYTVCTGARPWLDLELFENSSTRYYSRTYLEVRVVQY